MNESLLWLVNILSSTASIKTSSAADTLFLSTCEKNRVQEVLPNAFTRWCQTNHIFFTTTVGREDCSVFDVAVQFQYKNDELIIVVAKAILGDKIEVYTRYTADNELKEANGNTALLHEYFDDEPIYLLHLNASHQLPPSKGTPLKDFWQILMQDKKDVILVYVFAIFGGIINLTLPLGIQAIINLITMQQMNTSWWVLLFVVLSGIIFTGIAQIFQLSIIETLQQRLFFRAAFTFSSKLPKLNFEKLSGYYPPELVNRFFDVLTIQKGMTKILMDFSTSTLQILFGLLLLAFYHPFFIYFGTLWLVILIAIIRFTSPAGIRTSLEESKYKYKLVYWLEEVARNLTTFKLSDSQQYIFQRTDGNVTGYLKARKSHFAVLIQQFASIILFKFIVTGSLLVVGSILVMNQELNVGQFVAAEIIIILLMVAAEKLMNTMETVYDVLTAVEKLKGVTTLPEDETYASGFAPGDLSDGYTLQVKNVSYKYHDSQKNILQGVNFTAGKGEKIIIKATGGAGKTTLLKLLTGLYQPVEGQILLNDLPINGFRQDEILPHIGHNLDAGQIFNGTLEENISLGRIGITLDAIMEACRLSNLLPFIQQLPYGLLTELSPADRRLSAGFLKRISLARAIVHQPSLLILDDALPEMEIEPEQALFKYLIDGNDSKTVIIISDNKYLADNATKVYHLSNNRLELVNPKP